jgi:hypothetical protein
MHDLMHEHLPLGCHLTTSAVNKKGRHVPPFDFKPIGLFGETLDFSFLPVASECA